MKEIKENKALSSTIIRLDLTPITHSFSKIIKIIFRLLIPKSKSSRRDSKDTCLPVVDLKS